MCRALVIGLLWLIVRVSCCDETSATVFTGTQDIVISNNTLVGDNRRILVEGPAANQVTAINNSSE